MLKLIRNLIIVPVLLFTGVSLAHAENDWAASKTIVANFDQVLKQVKSKTKMSVAFPSQLPALPKGQFYYLSSMVNDDGSHYAITVDLSPDCNGAKYCSMGLIAADKNQHPQIHATIKGPDLTESVMINSSTRGYYTPAHAEADFWPSMIEWREQNVLYHISWKVDDAKIEKTVLQKLAAESIVKK